MSLLPFPALIVAPVPFCGSNVCVPALLGSTREHYHQPVPILAKIDPTARTKIDSVLIDADTHTLHVGEVTLLHSMDCRRRLDRSGHIQTIEPFGIRTVPLSIEVLVFSNLRPIVGAFLPFAMPTQRGISGYPLFSME